MKKFLSIAIVLVLLFTFVGCSTGGGDDPGAEGEKKWVFGISMPQLDNDGFRANLIGIEQAAEQFGNVELVVVDAQQNADTQMKQMEDLITQGVDAIVMCPVDSSAIVAAVEKANEAGIPVTSFDRNVSGGELVGLAESDNAAHGALAAELMADAAIANGMEISDLRVLELLGAQTTSSGLERHEGFVAKCEELGIEIVSALPTDWKVDVAYNAVLDAFQANADINAVYVPSDNGLYPGVEAALLELNKLIAVGEPGHIIMTTVDGGPQGLNAIRNNYVDGIAAQSKLLMSYEAMDLAYKTLNGETVSESVVKIPPVAVTIENVEDTSLWANAINQ